jgi:hypothetical protein
MNERKGRFWKSKTFRMDPVILGRFEACCRVLGMDEYEVQDILVREFVAKHWDQAQLDRFLPGDKPLTIHTDRVNVIATRVNVLVLKEQIAGQLKILARNGSNHGSTSFWKGRLQQSINTAARVPREERDDELRRLVAEAEKQFQEAPVS